jgi:hypothetical protein
MLVLMPVISYKNIIRIKINKFKSNIINHNLIMIFHIWIIIQNNPKNKN